jgi:hypothetical protein
MTDAEEVPFLNYDDIEVLAHSADLTAKVLKYRDLKRKTAFVLEQIHTLEKEIRAEIKDTGELPIVEGVTFKITHPKKERTKWNTAGLEGYAISNPDVLEFQTKYWASPSLSITVE